MGDRPTLVVRSSSRVGCSGAPVPVQQETLARNFVCRIIVFLDFFFVGKSGKFTFFTKILIFLQLPDVKAML